MKNFDLSRLEPFDYNNQRIYLAGDIKRTVRGVTSGVVNVFVSSAKTERVLYAVLAPGRFTLDINTQSDTMLEFEGDKKLVMSLLMPTVSQVLHGDAENKWTKIEHRPAINPEMAAVMGQLREMQHGMAVLTAENKAQRRARKRAEIDAVDPNKKAKPVQVDPALEDVTQGVTTEDTTKPEENEGK